MIESFSEGIGLQENSNFREGNIVTVKYFGESNCGRGTIWSEPILGGERLRESSILSGDQFGVSTFFRVNDVLQGGWHQTPL